jgi:hypothetical protein
MPSLDELRASVQAKYKPYEVDLGGGDVVVLEQALRLPKERRAEMRAAQDRMSADDATEDDIVAAMGDVFRAAAKDKAAVDRLLEQVGDDLAILKDDPRGLRGGHAGGKCLTLAALIDEHGSALAHDFAHHYPGLELPAVVADLCSDHPVRDPAYVLALITQLPDDSAFAASVQGGREFRGWGFERHVNVAVLDALQALRTSRGP